MTELAEKSMRAKGTIQENETERANKQFVQSKELQKKERSTYNYCSDEKVYNAKWYDNSIVNIASNWETHEPVRKVRQIIKGEAKEVTQPHPISSHNKGMGGVDLMDRLL